MTLRPLAAALLAVSALGLAACGEDTPSAAGSAESKDKARQAELKFASCMRDEGVDMPDPGPDGRRDLRIGGDSGISPEEFERASKACERYRDEIRPELTEAEQKEFREMALAHSRCMREHGIDMADPIFTERGAEVRMRGGSGKPNPEDPKFKAAEEACARFMKKPGQTEK